MVPYSPAVGAVNLTYEQLAEPERRPAGQSSPVATVAPVELRTRMNVSFWQRDSQAVELGGRLRGGEGSRAQQKSHTRAETRQPVRGGAEQDSTDESQRAIEGRS